MIFVLIQPDAMVLHVNCIYFVIASKMIALNQL